MHRLGFLFSKAMIQQVKKTAKRVLHPAAPVSFTQTGEHHPWLLKVDKEAAVCLVDRQGFEKGGFAMLPGEQDRFLVYDLSKDAFGNWHTYESRVVAEKRFLQIAQGIRNSTDEFLSLTQLRRLAALLTENGAPKYVRCYDNQGKSADRYTVVFAGNYKGRNGRCHYLVMNSTPFHPSFGIGQHGDSDHIIDQPSYRHLGRKIGFEQLPEDCQQFVWQSYRDIWDLPWSVQELTITEVSHEAAPV